MTDRQRRVLKIWQVLIAYATNRRIITYQQLSGLIDEPAVFPASLGNHLAPIETFCLGRGMPNLTVIAVSARTGEPGDGIGMRSNNVGTEREGVFGEPWFAKTPPMPGDFA